MASWLMTTWTSAPWRISSRITFGSSIAAIDPKHRGRFVGPPAVGSNGPESRDLDAWQSLERRVRKVRHASLLARPRAYHLKEVARLDGAMPGPEDVPPVAVPLPVFPATSQFAEVSRPVGSPREVVPARTV